MPPRAAASFHTDDVITDPTAIPETEDDAKEYEKELQAVGGDWAKVEPLARSLSQSDVATREARAMAYSALGNALENTGRPDEAIDAYRGAVRMGDATAQVLVDALLAGEHRGPVEAEHIPQNEAEAGEYVRLAGAAKDAGDWERADELYSAVYKSPANSAVAARSGGARNRVRAAPSQRGRRGHAVPAGGEPDRRRHRARLRARTDP